MKKIAAVLCLLIISSSVFAAAAPLSKIAARGDGFLCSFSPSNGMGGFVPVVFQKRDGCLQGEAQAFVGNQPLLIQALVCGESTMITARYNGDSKTYRNILTEDIDAVLNVGVGYDFALIHCGLKHELSRMPRNGFTMKFRGF